MKIVNGVLNLLHHLKERALFMFKNPLVVLLLDIPPAKEDILAFQCCCPLEPV
jgi:hypothetical protein